MNSKRLYELRYKGHITDSEYKELKSAIKAFEARPTGHWKKSYKSFNCSECGKIAYSWNCFGGYIQVKSAFCPHCGADMRGEI